MTSALQGSKQLDGDRGEPLDRLDGRVERPALRRRFPLGTTLAARGPANALTDLSGEPVHPGSGGEVARVLAELGEQSVEQALELAVGLRRCRPHGAEHPFPGNLDQPARVVGEALHRGLNALQRAYGLIAYLHRAAIHVASE